jgi:hypothetical protein
MTFSSVCFKESHPSPGLKLLVLTAYCSVLIGLHQGTGEQEDRDSIRIKLNNLPLLFPGLSKCP